MKLDFRNQRCQGLPLVLRLHLVKTLVKHLERHVDIFSRGILLLNRQPPGFAIGNLIFHIIDFIVNLIQTAIQVITLALGVPVIVNNPVYITFQISFAPFQLLDSGLITGNLPDDFR